MCGVKKILNKKCCIFFCCMHKSKSINNNKKKKVINNRRRPYDPRTYVEQWLIAEEEWFRIHRKGCFVVVDVHPVLEICSKVLRHLSMFVQHSFFQKEWPGLIRHRPPLAKASRDIWSSGYTWVLLYGVSGSIMIIKHLWESQRYPWSIGSKQYWKRTGMAVVLRK